MNQPERFPKFVSALVACLLMASNSHGGEVQANYAGAYKIDAELFVNGTRVEQVTIPADTRNHGDLSGLLHLNIKGNLARSWRLDFDTHFNSKTGIIWIVTIKDLDDVRPNLKEGTLRAEPQTVFSVIGQPSADGSLEVYKTLSERLVLTVRLDSDQGGATRPATRPALETEDGDKPQPESEGHSR